MFVFLEHTISDHTMFLHQTTVLAYPASVTYDKAPLSRHCDIGCVLNMISSMYCVGVKTGGSRVGGPEMCV